MAGESIQKKKQRDTSWVRGVAGGAKIWYNNRHSQGGSVE